MEKTPKKFFSSKVSIVGLFAALTVILTIPLTVLLSEQQQSTQSSAAGLTVTPLPLPTFIPLPRIGYIVGYIYRDQNQNGQREPEEMPVANATLMITQLIPGPSPTPRLTALLKTDVNGYFKYEFSNVQTGPLSFIIKLSLPPGYKTIDANPIVLSDLSPSAKKIVEFGIFPVPSVFPTPICIGPNCATPTPACIGACPKPTPTPTLTCLGQNCPTPNPR